MGKELKVNKHWGCNKRGEWKILTGKSFQEISIKSMQDKEFGLRLLQVTAFRHRQTPSWDQLLFSLMKQQSAVKFTKNTTFWLFLSCYVGMNSFFYILYIILYIYIRVSLDVCVCFIRFVYHFWSKI